MTTLPSYYLSKTLYEGDRTTDSRPAVIKFLRNEYPTFNELVQFRNQYTITNNLALLEIADLLSFLNSTLDRVSYSFNE